MEQSILDEIIRKHDLWWRDDDEGERANLVRANLDGASLDGASLVRASLDGANLVGANLEGATGNSRHIKCLQSNRYPITYTAEVMQIGCERHDINAWWKFPDSTIAAMDSGALDWWKVWKPILKKIIKISPAQATGYVEPEATEAA